jgi:hypothetical protein
MLWLKRLQLFPVEVKRILHDNVIVVVDNDICLLNPAQTIVVVEVMTTKMSMVLLL